MKDEKVIEKGRRKTIALVYTTILLLSILVSTMPQIGATGHTTMSMDPSYVYAKVGTNITININVAPDEWIDAVGTNLINFTAGKLECTKITIGDLFAAQTIWIEGTVNNTAGTIKDMLWASSAATNSNGTFVALNFIIVSAGISYINIDKGEAGMAYIGENVNFNITNNVTIEGHQYIPSPPTSFNAATYSQTQLNLTWTKGTWADTTYIEWNNVSVWTRGTGNQIYNGTGSSFPHTGLAAGKTYYYELWSWNNTDKFFSNTNTSGSGTTLGNYAPFNSNPNPSNGSTGNPLTFTWHIDITDADGDPMDIWLQCSDGTGAYMTSMPNGTLNLVITTSLNYLTTYTVWVNTTDGLYWDRDWYTFETRAQYIPSAPSGFTATPITRFRIDLAWTKGAGADKTWIVAKLGSAPTSRTDGTNLYYSTGTSYSHTLLSPSQHWYYRAYSWNDTDSTWSTAYVSTDTTTLANGIPTFGTPNPTNGSTNNPLTLTWGIPINDPNGDLMNINIDCSDGTGSYMTSMPNGTRNIVITTPLDYATTYTVWVNVTDSYGWTRHWYEFTTRNKYAPGEPLSFTATAITRFRIDLAWTKGSETDRTYIVTKLDSYPASRADGVNVYNGTGNSYSVSGLNPNEHWYYRAWSWNNTDRVFSSNYSSDDAITLANSAPTYGTPNPTNGSTGNPLTLNWSIPINDPNGDLMDIWIQSNCGTGAYMTSMPNGTYGIDIWEPLDYSTTYTIWVNATDSFNITRQWYTFETRAEDIPDPPVVFNAAATGANSINLAWTIGAKADKTIIYSNATGGWNVVYNGTGTATNILSLNAHTKYFYRAFSWNNTDAVISTSFLNASATTLNNPPNMPTNEIPANRSTYKSVYSKYLNVTVSDNNADLMDVYFYWGNGTAIAWIGSLSNNSVASIYLPTYLARGFLEHNTNYTWYVIIDDHYNTTRSKTNWFKTSQRWDLDEDRDVDVVDASAFVNHYGDIVSPPGSKSWDIDEDGDVDVIDASAFVNHYGQHY